VTEVVGVFVRFLGAPLPPCTTNALLRPYRRVVQPFRQHSVSLYFPAPPWFTTNAPVELDDAVSPFWVNLLRRLIRSQIGITFPQNIRSQQRLMPIRSNITAPPAEWYQHSFLLFIYQTPPARIVFADSVVA
jgi:hypothetical protein